MEAWLKKSWFFQQNMFRNFKNRYWEDLDEESIRQKIIYALSVCYGEKCLETKEYRDLPKRITEIIVNHSFSKKKRFFSCTFINLWLIDDDKEGIECVFWTENKDTEICIDTNCRKYQSWEHFTESNKLPECHVIYPKAGRYADKTKSDISYRELICEESVACGLKSKIKKYADVGATVVACTALGVLAINPVSLPLTISALTCSVIGGAVNTGFAVERLVDKVEHEELRLDYDSMFAISDVVISAMGVAAVAVSGCKILASGEKFLHSSGLVLKIGSNTATVCNALTTINGINVFIHTILEYRQKGIEKMKSLRLFQLTINFIFCINANLSLVKKLVEYISLQTLNDVVSSLLQQVKCVYSYIKPGHSISNDFNTLIQLLFPRELPLLKRITDSKTVQLVNKIVKDIKQKDTKDPLTLIYSIITQLPEVLKEIDQFCSQSKKQVENNFGINICRNIEKWVANDSHSSYEDKINLPFDLMNKVNETLISLHVIKEENSLKEKRHLLFNAVKTLLFRHDLKTYTYTVGEASFYCEKFSEIFSKLMDYIHYEYFLYAYKNGTVDLTYYYTYKLEIKDNIVDYIFNETLKLLSKCSYHLHAEYDFNFQKCFCEESSDESKSVFKFEVPKGNLNEKEYYDVAIRHLPSLSSKLTKNNTIFESHFDQLAIITSNDDKFKLIFYVTENGENLDGLLMYVK